MLTPSYKYRAENPGVNFQHLICELLPRLHSQATAVMMWGIGLDGELIFSH